MVERLLRRCWDRRQRYLEGRVRAGVRPSPGAATSKVLNESHEPTQRPLHLAAVEEAAHWTDLPTSVATQNPKGIPTQSPGLRGTSYPGETWTMNSTLKGLRHLATRTTDMAATPLGLRGICVLYPG